MEERIFESSLVISCITFYLCKFSCVSHPKQLWISLQQGFSLPLLNLMQNTWCPAFSPLASGNFAFKVALFNPTDLFCLCHCVTIYTNVDIYHNN